jgi:Trk K+ transport system NAD-binding subunit
MGDVLFLILRRLRAPLITLIAVYAISVAGLALIPAVDAQGKPGRMSIFHAFYVMSYTATTIGFGELPQPFNDAQRLWVMFAIYLSVIGWAYALGSVVALLNDAAFRALVARRMFVRRARAIAEPFYILCGYGQSGSRLARALDRLGNRLVIIEPQEERVARAAVQDYTTPPLTLTADARLADVLEDSGVRSPHCKGVIALASDDAVNQAIAIGARLLNPSLQIVARAKSHVAKVNLESFGGVQVINPFETFAYNLSAALTTPEILRIEEWLTAAPGTPCPERVRPPRGRWVLVGYGRFGRALAEVLDREGIDWKAFDPGIEQQRSRTVTHELLPLGGAAPAKDFSLAAERRLLQGDYTESILRDAGIADADVLVAGADVDAVNLGVTSLARRVKPGIFVVIRQNRVQDRALVDAARADVTFVQSEVMVHECLQLLRTPMLGRFIARLRDAEPDVATATLERVRADVGEGAPSAWAFDCDVMQPGMFAACFQNPAGAFRIRHLLADPTNPGECMRAAALMLERKNTAQLLPALDTPLTPGDRILFVGGDSVRRLQRRYLTEPGTVSWVLTGTEPPRGFLFRWLQQRARRAA